MQGPSLGVPAEGTVPQTYEAALPGVPALSVTGKGVGGTLLVLLLSCKVVRGKNGASYQFLPSQFGGWWPRYGDQGRVSAGMQMELGGGSGGHTCGCRHD